MAWVSGRFRYSPIASKRSDVYETSKQAGILFFESEFEAVDEAQWILVDVTAYALCACQMHGTDVLLRPMNSNSDLAPVSSLPDDNPEISFSSGSQPSGTWFIPCDGGMIAGASSRSFVWIGYLPFSIIWTRGTIIGIYGNINGESGICYLMLFAAVLFTYVGLAFWLTTIMSMMGKVEITMQCNDGRVFVGVWRIGWTRRFKWSDVTAIEFAKSSIQYPGRSSRHIEIHADRRIGIGVSLPADRQAFLLKAVDKMRQLSR